MLGCLKIYITGEFDFDYNISSLLQGVLMEYISSDTAEFLHINGFHPYSQSIMRCDDKMFVWQVCTLNAHMKKEIIDVLLQEDVKQITLKKKNLILDIARKEYQELRLNK